MSLPQPSRRPRLERLLSQLPAVNRSLWSGYQRALHARLERLSPEDVLLAEPILANHFG